MNFSVKLPHVVQGLLAALIVGGMWWMRAQQPQIDATVPATLTVGVVVKLLVGLFSSSVSGSTNILAGQRAANALKLTGAVLLMGVFGLTQTACTSAVWQQLVSSVETALENGSALSAIEALVVQYFPQYAGDANIIDSIAQAVISLLQASGVLPTPAQATAGMLQSQLQQKLAASKKTSAVWPADVRELIASIERGTPSPRAAELVAAIQGRVVR